MSDMLRRVTMMMAKAVSSITYATWNPADNTNATLTSSNTVIATTTVSNPVGARSTLSKSSGKWYWEVKRGASGNATTYCGIATSGAAFTGVNANTTVYGNGGIIYDAGSFVGTATAQANGDVVGFALDAGGGTLKIYINNVLQNTVTYTPTNPVFAYAYYSDNNTGNTLIGNFGATALTYTPPAGYNAGLYT